MKVKEKICIKFSIGLLFRKVGNFPVWGQIIDANRRLQNKRRESILNGNWFRVLNFCHQCAIQFFPSGVPFCMFSESVLRLLSDGLFNILLFPHWVYSIPTQKLVQTFHWTIYSTLSALWVSPGCEQTTLRKDISHLPVPKLLPFIQSQHTVHLRLLHEQCKKPGTTISVLSKILTGSPYHRNKSKFTFAAEKRNHST